MSTATLDRSTLKPTTIAYGRGKGGTTSAVLTDGVTNFCGSEGCDFTRDSWGSVFAHRGHCKHKGNVLALPVQAAAPVAEKVVEKVTTSVPEERVVAHTEAKQHTEAIVTALAGLAAALADVSTYVDQVVTLTERAWAVRADLTLGYNGPKAWEVYVHDHYAALSGVKLVEEDRLRLADALWGPDGTRMSIRGVARQLGYVEGTLRRDLKRRDAALNPQPAVEPDVVVGEIVEAEESEEMVVDVIAATVTGQDLQRRLERNAAVAACAVPPAQTLAVTTLVSGEVTITKPINVDFSLIAEKAAPETPEAPQGNPGYSRASQRILTSIEAQIEEEVQRRVRRLSEVAQGEHKRELAAERTKTQEWRQRAIDAEGRFETIRQAVAGIAA